MYLFTFSLLGLIFGSFLSFLSYRLAHNKNLFAKRSKCHQCNHDLKVIDLIPVLSWIFLSGKCRYSGTKVSKRYITIEIFTSIIFSLIYYFYGLNSVGIFLLCISSIFIIISVIDFEFYIIHDSVLIALFVTLFTYHLSIGNYYLDFFINSLTGFLSAISISYIFKLLYKKEGIGFADIKLITILAGIIGYQNLSTFYLATGIIGTINGLAWIYILKRKLFPFAPTICLSFMLCFNISLKLGYQDMIVFDMLDVIVY
jgi:leader peptidase (prepilin peptidase) / N-methyltransferase